MSIQQAFPNNMGIGPQQLQQMSWQMQGQHFLMDWPGRMEKSFADDLPDPLWQEI